MDEPKQDAYALHTFLPPSCTHSILHHQSRIRPYPWRARRDDVRIAVGIEHITVVCKDHVVVCSLFPSDECNAAGVHSPIRSGIHGGPDGAYSIVLSGGYEDDKDSWEDEDMEDTGEIMCVSIPPLRLVWPCLNYCCSANTRVLVDETRFVSMAVRVYSQAHVHLAC